MDILNMDPKVLLLQIFGFILMLWLFKRYLFGPVGEALENRRKEIAATYSAADQAKAEMEELRRDYEKRIADIETEAHEKLQAVIKEAQGIKDEIVNDARSRAEAVLQRGADELIRERDKTIVAMRQEVADLVISAASNLIDKTMDEPTHRKLVDDFISSVGKTK